MELQNQGMQVVAAAGEKLVKRPALTDKPQMRPNAVEGDARENRTESASLDKAEAQEMVADIQSKLDSQGVELKIKLVEDAGAVQVEVRDQESDKLIRKLPPDDMLKLSASMKELAGALMNQPI